MEGQDARVETFYPEIVKGVLPSRQVVSGLQTGVPYFLRVGAANGLGYGEYGDNVAKAKAAKVPGAPEGLSAGVALHVNEVSCSIIVLPSRLMHSLSKSSGDKYIRARITLFRRSTPWII